MNIDSLKYSQAVLRSESGVTVDLHAMHSADGGSVVLSFYSDSSCGLSAGFHLTGDEAVFLAAQLALHANAADRIESLSPTPPDPTAASLPAAGGAFSNEVTP